MSRSSPDSVLQPDDVLREAQSLLRYYQEVHPPMPYTAIVIADCIATIEKLRASVKPDVAQAAQPTGVDQAAVVEAHEHLKKGIKIISDRSYGHGPDVPIELHKAAQALHHALNDASPQAATGTGDLVNRLLAAPVTLKTGREAAAVIAELEAENKRLRAEPQTAQENREALQKALTAMTIASSIEAISDEYDFSYAIDAVRSALTRPERS